MKKRITTFSIYRNKKSQKSKVQKAVRIRKQTVCPIQPRNRFALPKINATYCDDHLHPSMSSCPFSLKG